ncbi:MAG: outer membrane protein assembly factor BamD [Mariprofundaceae bacterium]
MHFIRPSIIALTLILAFSGCASDKVHEDTAQNEYEHAKHLINEGDYGRATMDLEKYSSRHPYSRFAIRAELLRIFSAYKGGEYVLSETLANRFIDRHPRHPNVDYAKYMLAMSHYRERSDAENDPTQTLLAIDSFKTLLKDHPQSSYANDGRRYLQKLYNTLAEHELTVGKFYFENDRYVAAANRFQGIIEKYQTTPSIEEALYYLAASYAELEQKENAHQVAVLLQHNYPNSSWSEKVADFR